MGGEGKDSAFEFVLADAIVNVCDAEDVPIEVLHWLVSPAGSKTLRTIVGIMMVDWQAEQQPQGGHLYRVGPTNGNAPFSAPIVYVQPEFEELKRRFPAYVDPDYMGKRFDPIKRCKVVSKENRDVDFEYVHNMDKYASTNEVLAEMDRKRLRPALYEELLGFAEKYPDEQRKYPIVALGSESCVRSGRSVACLWSVGDKRGLSLLWLGFGWLDHCRFLAVHK